MATKFSQFFNGGLLKAGDIPVGLENGINTQFEFAGSGSSTSSLITLITQVNHGFSVNQIVYNNAGVFTLAKADTAADAEVIGIVSAVIDANNFDLLTNGYVSTLTALTPGGVYFLSDITAGALTLTEPTIPGRISKPLIIATSNTTAFFFNFRGKVISQDIPSPLIWTAVNVDTLMAINNGYYTTGGGTLNMTLPTVASAGLTIRIAGFESTGWKIVQNSGQQISFGNLTTTSGVTGYLQSTSATDCIEILCTTANVNFVVLSSMGNITFNQEL